MEQQQKEQQLQQQQQQQQSLIRELDEMRKREAAVLQKQCELAARQINARAGHSGDVRCSASIAQNRFPNDSARTVMVTDDKNLNRSSDFVNTAQNSSTPTDVLTDAAKSVAASTNDAKVSVAEQLKTTTSAPELPCGTSKTTVSFAKPADPLKSNEPMNQLTASTCGQLTKASNSNAMRNLSLRISTCKSTPTTRTQKEAKAEKVSVNHRLIVKSMDAMNAESNTRTSVSSRLNVLANKLQIPNGSVAQTSGELTPNKTSDYRSVLNRRKVFFAPRPLKPETINAQLEAQMKETNTTNATNTTNTTDTTDHNTSTIPDYSKTTKEVEEMVSTAIERPFEIWIFSLIVSLSFRSTVQRNANRSKWNDRLYHGNTKCSQESPWSYDNSRIFMKIPPIILIWIENESKTINALTDSITLNWWHHFLNTQDPVKKTTCLRFTTIE